jgi:endonuclease YncB( thermonuclease family)
MIYRRSSRQIVWSRRPARLDAGLVIGIILALALIIVNAYRYKPWIAMPRTVISGKAWVIDGDTIEISGNRIRLEGIDAPELDQTCTDPAGRRWPCGRTAGNELRAHIGARELTCRTGGFDRYRRALAICTLPDRSDINAWMVRQGWALATDFRGTYASEEAEAKAGSCGIWVGTFVPPSQWRHRNQDYRHARPLG